MATIPLPLPQLFPEQQEDLLWVWHQADGALGRRSSQGAIQARLEGRTSSPHGIDDPYEGLKEVLTRSNFKAAGRYRCIMTAWSRCTEHNRAVLSAVYWTPLQRGLDAWDRLSNLVALSSVAIGRYKAAGVVTSFGEWAMNLSLRFMGAPGKNGIRKDPTASEYEVRSVRSIERELESMLVKALEEYADHHGNVEVIEELRHG